MNMCSEWTYEGRVSAEKQVACDGNSTRYQGSIHDGVWNEWAMISSNWVVPQENLQLLSLYPKKDRDKSFFIS